MTEENNMYWLSKTYFNELLSKTCAKLIDHLDKYVLDGDALALKCLYGQLLRILSEHAGEAGQSESAVDCLKRLINDLHYIKENWVKPYVASKGEGFIKYGDSYEDINKILPNYLYSDPNKLVQFGDTKRIPTDCVRPPMFGSVTITTEPMLSWNNQNHIPVK